MISTKGRESVDQLSNYQFLHETVTYSDIWQFMQRLHRSVSFSGDSAGKLRHTVSTSLKENPKKLIKIVREVVT
jgi:hypothetical protein